MISKSSEEVHLKKGSRPDVFCEKVVLQAAPATLLKKRL